MFFLASILLKALIKVENGLVIGRVSFLAFDPAEGRLVGLVLQKGLFRKEAFVVAPKAILSAGNGKVLIKNIDVVDPISEIIRANQVWQDKLDLFDMPAQTESGKYLGTLKDMLLDQEGFYIHRFYLSGSDGERILPRDSAIGIQKKRLIFKDDVLTKPSVKEKPTPSLSPVPALT